MAFRTLRCGLICKIVRNVIDQDKSCILISEKAHRQTPMGFLSRRSIRTRGQYPLTHNDHNPYQAHAYMTIGANRDETQSVQPNRD